MKKISILCALVLSALFLVSCRNDSSDSQKNYADLIDNIALAGKKHNEGLDLFLNAIKKNPEKLNAFYKLSASNKTSRAPSSNLELISDLTDIQFSVFVNQSDFNSLTEQQLKQTLTSANTGLVNSVSENGFVPTNPELSGQIYYSTDEQYLSPKVKELLNILQVSINDDGDYDTTIQTFNSIENRANLECTEQEKVIIISAVNVGKNSLNYWYNNAQNWENVGSVAGKGTKPKAWKVIAGADVAGAVTGAVRAAVINLWPGAGQAAYGAAIVGSALGGSAGAAVLYYLWN